MSPSVQRQRFGYKKIGFDLRKMIKDWNENVSREAGYELINSKPDILMNSVMLQL